MSTRHSQDWYLVEIDDHSKSIHAAFVSGGGDIMVSVSLDNTVWTWSNFILPGSKPACEVRSCHLVTLYTSHLHTSNLYDNRSLNMIITPGVGWALFDWLSIRSSLYYCASCILIIFSPYVHIFRWIIVVAGGAKMNLIFIEHLKFNKAIQMFYGYLVHLSFSGCYK